MFESGRKRLKKVLAFDWDARTLRIIHALRNKRGMTIDRLLSIAIPSNIDPNDPQRMGQHIRRALDQEGITTKHAIVDIPRDQAILKTLHLPAARSEDLPGMVEIQIAKELPFPVTGAVVDFTVDPQTAESTTTDVLVAAVRHEQLEQYIETFHQAGLKLDRIGLRPHANKVAVCQMLRFAMPERVMFIDVRPSLTEIDILKDAVLSFSRAASVMIPKNVTDVPRLSFAREDVTKIDEDLSEMSETILQGEDSDVSINRSGTTSGMDEVIHSLVLEVTRSIEAYRTTDAGATIDHVVIGGDMGIEERLAEVIQKRLDITTEIYNPASTFGWDPEEGAAASACSASLGLVLAQEQEPSQYFDFLHPKQTVSIAQERLKKAPLVAAVIVLFLSAMAVGFAQFTRADREQLVRIEKTIHDLEAKRSGNKKFLKMMDQIRSFDSDQHIWMDVMFDVLQMMPSHKEMFISHMELKQKEGIIILKTQSKDRDKATEMIKKLTAYRREGKELPRFKASMGPQSEKKKELYPFTQEIRIQILRDEKNASRKTTGRSSRKK